MKHNATFRLVLICGGIIVSLLVMLGWLIESRVIVQIHPDFHPMQFNTALGFLLLNTALLALHLGRSRLSIVLASLLILLFTLTLLEHILRLQLRIDTLFVDPFVTQEFAPPGRPGANTSVCFWLMGIAVWMFSLRLKQPGLWIVSVTTIVLGMSLSSLWGYAEGLHELTGWGPYFSGMAVHTSVAFVFASLALLSLKLTRAIRHGRRFYAFRPVHASILVLIVTLTVWNAMRQWDQDRVQAELQRNAQAIVGSVEIGFAYRLNAYLRLAQRWESSGITPEAWLTDAGNYIGDMPGLLMIRLQADHQKLQQLGPALDQDLADRIVSQYAQSGLIGMNSVVRLNGRVYIIVDINLSREGKPIGDLLCVMDLERWMNRFAANLADGLRLELSENGSVLFVTGTDRRTVERLSAGIQFHLQGFGHAFLLELKPTVGYIARERSPWTLAILIGGLVGSFVLWLILKQALLLIRSRHEIRQQASELTNKSIQLAQANGELTVVNREMEHLNRAISHDLHSPLFSIKNYLALMHNAWREGDHGAIDEYIGRVSQISDRMSVTIDSLLTVCAIGGDTSRHVRVRLNPLIDDVLEYIEGDIQDASAKIEIDDNLPDVIADPVLLGNIIQNLVSNATKHARVPGQQLRIHIGTKREGEMICLFVDDNGVGVSPEHRVTIFEVFQRVGGTGVAGSGIGLSIVSRGIRSHGGEAWVEDSPMGGARFCVTLRPADG